MTSLFADEQINSALLDEYAPVLKAAAEQLPRNPEWAVPLIALVCARIGMYRQWSQISEFADLGTCNDIEYALAFSECLRSRWIELQHKKRVEAEAQGDHHALTDQAMKIVRHGAASADDHVCLAHALARAEHLDEAIGEVRIALVLAPDHLDYLQMLASLLERSKHFDEAYATASRAASLSETTGTRVDLERIRMAYAASLRGSMESHQDARSRVETAQRLRQIGCETAADAASLAQFERCLGRFDEALASIDRALTHQPGNVQFRRMRIRLLEQCGDFRAALEEARSALKQAPHEKELRNAVRRLRIRYAVDRLFSRFTVDIKHSRQAA